MLKPGDKIFCEDYKKTGKIISLRDDTYERKQRQKNHNHPFYYHIHFDDGSSDTYVCGNSLVKLFTS